MTRTWLIATLLLSSPASAKCATRWLQAWPASGSLPENGRIVLSGFGYDEPFVATLAERRPVLTDGTAEIPLGIVELNVGQGVTQAVLVPKQPLVSGRRYALKADPLKDDPRFALDFFWFVEAPVAGSPKWTAAPQVLSTEHQKMGCGPQVEAKVEVKLEQPELVRVLAELRDVKAGTTARFLISKTTPEAEVRIGHGMCGGEFRLAPGVDFELTLWAVDVAGHTTPAPGPALHFVGPQAGTRQQVAPESTWDAVKKYFGK